jgi:hypothetical protein
LQVLKSDVLTWWQESKPAWRPRKEAYIASLADNSSDAVSAITRLEMISPDEDQEGLRSLENLGREMTGNVIGYVSCHERLFLKTGGSPLASRIYMRAESAETFAWDMIDRYVGDWNAHKLRTSEGWERQRRLETLLLPPTRETS